MDEPARYSVARWQASAEADSPFTRPTLNPDAAAARALVDHEGLFGAIAQTDALCLASGCGRQSAAFLLLGARVTALDLSETQPARDRATATHYGVGMVVEQGDMHGPVAVPGGVRHRVHQATAAHGAGIGAVPYLTG